MQPLTLFLYHYCPTHHFSDDGALRHQVSRICNSPLKYKYIVVTEHLLYVPESCKAQQSLLE